MVGSPDDDDEEEDVANDVDDDDDADQEEVQGLVDSPAGYSPFAVMGGTGIDLKRPLDLNILHRS
jgi:hypothetical protein